MAWTSQLPEFIIQRIQSFLSTKEAVRCSVLSTAWHQAWSTSPFLVFNQNLFEDTTSRFLNFVDTNLMRYSSNNIRINLLCIIVVTLSGTNLTSLLDKWLQIAIECGVKQLYLSLPQVNSLHTLPATIYEAASLKFLDLASFKFDNNFLTRTIKFNSLRYLALHYVYLDELMIHKLIFSCPLIETLILDCCSGFQRFQLTSHHALKVFHIYAKEIQAVEIDAPSLQSFTCKFGRWTLPCAIKTDSSKHLRNLCLKAVPINDVFFHNLVSKLPFLENLNLQNCTSLRRINLLNHQLKHLAINSNLPMQMDWIEMNTWNLQSLHYHSLNELPYFTFSNNTSLQMSSCLALICYGDLHFSWFCKLFDFLKKTGHCKVQIRVQSHARLTVNTAEFRAIPVAIQHSQVEELWVNIWSSRSTFETLLEGLFWSCRPKYLMVYLNNGVDNMFVDFVREKLILERRDVLNCCHRFHIKCWRHFLADVKIVSSYETLSGESVDETTVSCFELNWV
ncbi:hypothetical protein LguiA_031151 [Lonicera macranthoides]